jgi:hypothetical protein
VNGGAQSDGARNQFIGEGGPGGDFCPQLFGRPGWQRFRVIQPIENVRGVAQMVLMRLVASTRFRVGEIKSEIAADKGQGAGAGEGKVQGSNRHYHLYKLS